MRLFRFCRRPTVPALCLPVAAIAFCGFPAGVQGAQRKAEELPPFKEVQATVARELAAKKGYRKGDLLSQSDVRRVLKAIEQLGWKVADGDKIVAAALPDNDFLVRTLRTPRGVWFMRKLSGTPHTYDRMDRLRRMPYGQRRIREFMANPGGYTMILYMARSPYGKTLGNYLSQTPTGKNFNQPTRRIYKGQDLVDRLQRSYAAEQERRRHANALKVPAKKR